VTTAQAIIIASCILVTAETIRSLFAWFVVYPWQERQRYKRSPWRTYTAPQDDKEGK